MAAPVPKTRQDLSMPGLLSRVRAAFDTVPDKRRVSHVKFSMPDTLCSALAMFSLKYSSLLQFDGDMRADAGTVRHNLHTLFGVSQAPCDTQMRDILDPVKPSALRPAFRALHTALQRGGVLKDFAWLDGKYLLAIDGTGHYSSSKIRCPHCCVKHHKSGDEFYHQLLPATIVHPNHNKALPLDFEPITHRDGTTKNDCERNAAKRLLESVRQQYPNRGFVVVEDALASNGPHIKELQRHGMDFILGAKEGGNPKLFATVFDPLKQSACVESDPTDVNSKGFSCGYRFTNQVALNESHSDLLVNFIEYWEVDKNDKETIFAWVTNLPITRENAYALARGGRTRWKIENELFNTLKNQGYNLERSYGHGKQYLSSVLGGLTLLASLIDQIQEHACRLFQSARAAYHARIVLWKKLHALFFTFDILTWESLWHALANPGSFRMGLPDTTPS